MTSQALSLVLVAALLHATWNTLTKRATDGFLFLWCSMSIASLVMLPFAIRIGVAPAFAPAVLPFVIGTAVIHAVYFVTLGTAYGHGDLSLVYPIARGLGVALVPLIGLAFGERPSALGAIGIALVVIGVATNAFAKPPDDTPPSSRKKRLESKGVAWAIVTGVLIASYSMVDAAGARRMQPIPFVTLMSIGAVTLSSPLVFKRRLALVEEIRKNGFRIALASTMNLSGYVLVLFAYRTSKTAYVVATREVSIVVSALVGTLLLREGRTLVRLLGATIILLGVACVAAAR